MIQVSTVEELRLQIAEWTDPETKIVLVPTMGGLHEGHLTLMRYAQELGQKVIATIFVNPNQFNDAADFKNYPRDEKRDLRLLYEEGVDMVFMPSPEEMYPEPFLTKVTVGSISEDLEGAHRPGHFEGVATVVAKLLIQTLPDFAIFGEKDFQQFCIIEQMAKDLNLPVEILGAKTVRDEHGLALSSRNVRLSDDGLNQARKLNKVLYALAQDIQTGQIMPDAAAEIGLKKLKEKGFDQVDYLDLRTEYTFEKIGADNIQPHMRLLSAVTVERVRLIDNVPVKNASEWSGAFKTDT